MKKSNGITYLGLAVALATWYNKKRKLQGRDREIIDMENYMQTTGIKQTVIQEIQELAVKHWCFQSDFVWFKSKRYF